MNGAGETSRKTVAAGGRCGFSLFFASFLSVPISLQMTGRLSHPIRANCFFRCFSTIPIPSLAVSLQRLISGKIISKKKSTNMAGPYGRRCTIPMIQQSATSLLRWLRHSGSRVKTNGARITLSAQKIPNVQSEIGIGLVQMTRHVMFLHVCFTAFVFPYCLRLS